MQSVYQKDGGMTGMYYDGRAYLNAIDEKYDVIMVDAYQDISIPFQMSSIEFFTLVKEHLTDTISHVFSDVYTVDVQGATNRELFALNNSQMLSRFADNLALEKEEQLLAMMYIQEYFLWICY